MQKEIIQKPEIKLVGLCVRTNNKNEMDPATGKIGPLIQHYWNQNIAAQIQARKNPGVTFSVYTDYATDEHGDYTYFVGEEVSAFNHIPPDLQTCLIASALYQKFTTSAGKMPDIVIQAWQQIWAMTPAELGGKRAYLADFEVYDQRASDPSRAIVDLYIGIL